MEIEETGYVRCVGIDPGNKGAIAVVKIGPNGEVVYIDHLLMPLIDRNSGSSWSDYRDLEAFKRQQKKGLKRKLKPSEKVKPFPDVSKIAGFIEEHGTQAIALEKMFDGGMSRNEGASTLMNAYGGLVGISHYVSSSVCQQCDVVEVAPRTWQKVMLGAGKDSLTKELAIDFCVKILGYDLPMTSTSEKAKPMDGVSDAVVIACYCAYEKFGRTHIGEWKYG